MCSRDPRGEPEGDGKACRGQEDLHRGEPHPRGAGRRGRRRDLRRPYRGLEEAVEQDGNALMQTAAPAQEKAKSGSSSNWRQLLRWGPQVPRHRFASPDKSLQRQPETDFRVNQGADGKGLWPDPSCLSTGTCSARAWLCSRSRLGNYQNHVRWSWQIGGILDDVVAGENERATARAALLLAAADQASIDGGSWVVSTVSLLEPLPPYPRVLQAHSAKPNRESDKCTLRWAEIFLGSLKDRESYNEAKKKLQAAEHGAMAEIRVRRIHLEASLSKGKEREAKSRKVGRIKRLTSDAQVGRGGLRLGRSFGFAYLLESKSLVFWRPSPWTAETTL